MAPPTEAQSSLRKRTVYQLDTPFSTVLWPEVSPEDQDTILELLCSLLSPLGRHRREHTKPSKGKKTAKIEKKQKEPAVDDLIPPAPELSQKVDIGLNSITRKLETKSGPSTKKSGDSDASDHGPPYAMIFVARGDQSTTFSCHFPTMVGAASKDLPPDEKTRLVGFSKPCSERLSNALHLARVSSVAVAHGAPGAGALWQIVKKTVAPVDISWLGGGQNVSFLPTQINSIQTTVGIKRVKQGSE